MVSFTNHSSEKDPDKMGVLYKNEKWVTFKEYGLFATISFDEGKT